MTEAETLEALLKCQNSGDPEAAHSKADLILCEFLCTLGYDNIVKEYNKVEKWFA
jgi:hypothetical protein